MQNKNILLYIFKERSIVNAIDFFKGSENCYFKFIDEDRILVCEFDRKIIVEINEIFKFQDEIYSFIKDKFSVFIFLNKKEEKKYFCLLSFEKNKFKDIFINHVFITFILKFFYRIFWKNINSIAFLFIVFSMFYFIFNNNIVNENIDTIKNNYLLQKKINIGYKNILPLIKINEHENIKIKRNIILAIKNKNTLKKDHFKRERSKDNYLLKLIDKDAEHFLKMNKNIKKK